MLLTTKAERVAEYAEAEKVLAMDDPAFPPAVRVRQNAHADYLMRLCQDVDRLEKVLREVHEEGCADCEKAVPCNVSAVLGE